MSIVMPDSMDDCVYFTRRVWEPRGKAIAWVKRMVCPKCKKDEMGKPLDPKTKRPKIRAEIYECPNCKFSEGKDEHEPKLTVEILYTCQHCGNSGEATTPYTRKTWEGVPAYVFECGKCKQKIGLTKKMKAKKGEKKPAPVDDE